MSKRMDYLERYSAGWSEDSVRLIITSGSFAKATYFYAQEAGYFKTDESYFTERQNLNSFLIVYTISGKGNLTYDGESYELTGGSCFFINCMKHHFYHTAPGEHWEFLWLHFNGRSALGYYEEFVKNGFQIVPVQDTFLVETNLRRILAINQRRTVSTEVLTSSLITNLLTELLIQTMTFHTQKLLIPDYVKKALDLLDRNFRSQLSLDALAALVGVSKFHLSKEFKKYTGTTVNEYLITTRISYAKELLKYSSMSVHEIAYDCGMSNVSHFINLFKAREGTTPLAYRREWQHSK